MSNPYLRHLKKKQGSFNGSSNEGSIQGSSNVVVDFYNKNKTIILGATAVAIAIPVGLKIYRTVRGSGNAHEEIEEDITFDAEIPSEKSESQIMIEDMIQGSKAEHKEDDLDEEDLLPLENIGSEVIVQEDMIGGMNQSQKSQDISSISFSESDFLVPEGEDIDVGVM